MGKLSRAKGETLERALADLHGRYEAEELAVMRHNGLTARMVKRGRRVKPITSKSAPDYTGSLWPDGRRVEFDAKSISGTYYYHEAGRAHQLRQLWQVAQTGALAGLLVVVDNEQGFWVWPQEDWAMTYGDTSWSIQLARAGEGEALPLPDAGLYFGWYVPDWIHAARFVPAGVE